MALTHPQADSTTKNEVSVAPLFSLETQHVPRNRLPDREMAPDVAYQIVHDELMLDGNARMNLATFVSTWMEPQAVRLIAETLDKNMIDKDEYPQTAELEKRCVKMLSTLWHAPAADEATGCSTTGLERGRDARRPGAQAALAAAAAGGEASRPTSRTS